MRSMGDDLKNTTESANISALRNILASREQANQSLLQYVEKTKIVFYELSLDLKEIIKVNVAAEKIWRHPHYQLIKNSSTWFSAIHPEDRKIVKSVLTDMVACQKEELLLEYRLRHQDLSCSHILDSVRLITNEFGEPRSIMGVAADMSHYLFAKRKLFVYEQILHAHAEEKNNNLFFDAVLKIIANFFDWDFAELWVLDEGGQFFYCTNVWAKDDKHRKKPYIISNEMKIKASAEFNGYVAKNKRPVVVTEISPASQFPRLRQAAEANFLSALGINIYAEKKLQGQMFFFSQRLKNPDNVDDESIAKMIQILGPIIHKNTSTDMLNYLSTHDKPTGYLNQYGFEVGITDILEQSKQGNCAIVVVKIRGLKNFIDLRGDITGQRLMIKVIRRLQTELSHSIKLVSKITETKIALFIDNLNEKFEVENIIQNLLNCFNRDFSVDAEPVTLFANIGISLYPLDSNVPATLLHKAIIACHHAEALGNNAYHFFSEKFVRAMERATRIENKLRNAIQDNQLQLYYQPKVDISTNSIIGVEALVRWKDDELGAISPAEFITIAEQSELIILLDQWVLREVLRHFPFKELNIAVSINLSARHLGSNYNIVAFIKNLLETYHVHGKLIDLELTEYQLAQDKEQSMSVFNELRKAHVTFSIDDFGTGYSSFEYLKLFHPNTVKIDKSFINELPHNLENLGIVRAIIALSKVLNIKSIAEGVETKEQLDCLLQEGCDQIQGFYFSKPIPLVDLKGLIQQHNKKLPKE